MTLEQPYPPSLECAWGNVLAELHRDASSDSNQGLDRLVSLDFVSDLLSPEGFEVSSTAGHDEQKLARVASLELLSELFGVEGSLGEGQGNCLKEGSGVSIEVSNGVPKGWTEEGLPGQENAQVHRTESSSWQMDSNWNLTGRRWECEAGEQPGLSLPQSTKTVHSSLLQQAASGDNAKAQQANPTVIHPVQKVPCPNAQSIPCPKVQSIPCAKVLPQIPPFRGTGQLPTPAPPTQAPPTPSLTTSELSDPLANPRTRFTAKQQRVLYDFGISINWMTSALEAEPRAHKLCAKMGIGFRQLKKWLSNHRPREQRPPVSHPPWILPAGAVARGATSRPPLSQAAMASLAAAEAAVMGQPFPSPYDPNLVVPSPFSPLHNAWPHPGPPVPLGAFPLPIPTPFGGPHVPFANGGLAPPQFPQGDVHHHRWASGSSNESQVIGGPEARRQAGVTAKVSPEEGANKGVSSADVKKVLRRKLKDFEPEKVRRLFDLCVEYRQKRRMGGTPSGPSEPASKRQRTIVSGPPLITGLVVPPLTPPNLPTQSGLGPSSESGDTSGLTECEEPKTVLPNLEPTSSTGWQIPAVPTPLESGGSYPEAWNSGSLQGQPFSSIPCFPSINLSQWELEGFTGVTSEGQARAPETPQLAPESPGFGYPNANPGFEGIVEGLPLPSAVLPAHPLADEIWARIERRQSVSRAARNPSRTIQRKTSGLTRRVSTGLTGRGSTGITGQDSTGLTGRASTGVSGGGSPGLSGRGLDGLTGRGSTSLTGRDSTGPTGRPSTGLTARGSTGLTGRISTGLTPRKERKAPVQIPGCRFLFEKILTMSDTTPLGRIIVPKVHAEAHLPRVASKDGLLLPVTDADGNTWELRYSAWLNNKSRMYVLEHVGDLLQDRRLAPGDSIAFYRADDGRLILIDQKHRKPPKSTPRSGGSGAACGFDVESTF